MEYREKALREHGRACVECGATDELDVHHVDGDRTNNELDNLIPLCRSCHQRVHARHPELSKWVEQLKPRDEISGESATTVEISRDTHSALNTLKEPGERYVDTVAAGLRALKETEPERLQVDL